MNNRTNYFETCEEGLKRSSNSIGGGSENRNTETNISPLGMECSTNTIEVTIEEYTRLKDIETRFHILRENMIHADYCPIHHQIILGIEKEYKKKEIELIPLK